jgi:tetratricopeptide (TPR) repeat protein
MGTCASNALQTEWRKSSFPFWLLIVLGLAGGQASAEQSPPACTPVIARIVSVQGPVEISRAGSNDWAPVTRLDTSVCLSDRLRTGARGRAALFVEPETVVRVDQHTTVALTQTEAETVVEFFQGEARQLVHHAQSCGAGYFISRFPKKLKVNTKYLNAAIEGTEFGVAMRCESTELFVAEGTVRSRVVATGEERVLTSGESLVAEPSGSTVFTANIYPANAAQWVLYYPPLAVAGATRLPTSQQCRGLGSPGNETCLNERAEVLLREGRTDEALASIDEALALNPGNADASALRAIIQIARNDVTAALELADAATTSAPANYRGWLALSYAQQAKFELDQALRSAQRAQSLLPMDPLTNARVAELLLSLGRIREAEAAAREAVRANPEEALGHTILGFVHLAQIRTEEAQADFRTAIESDSFAPLSRLGLGLAIIRDGNLVSGREQLEIAVALDPQNSLLRSYVGKAYYEENHADRDALAATQFDLAKQLDSNDPTPWFYQAILRLSENRPVDALEELNVSVEKNDDRAVYRSRFMLDDDNASRTANVAAVYSNLGFERLAILESTKAIEENPGNSSAHEMLATSYANLPRYDIARVSEALQAQIRRPLSLSPVPPLLSTDNLAILRDTGPSRSATNEYNALFNREGFRLEADGMAGGRDSAGEQLIASALVGRVSAALSQVHYETDGFTENDSSEKDIYDLFVHGEIARNSSLQLDLKRYEFTIGETFLRFDPGSVLPFLINEEGDSVRLSGHHSTATGSDWIASAVYEDRNRSLEFIPFDLLVSEVDGNAYAGEVQNQKQWGAVQTVWGVGYVEDENDFRFDLITEESTAFNAYAYGQWRSPSDVLKIHLGLGADRYRKDTSVNSKSVSRDELSPKLGLTWTPRPGTSLRLAAFSSVRRPLVASQTIEPTQVVGFSQYFSGFEELYGDVEGTISRRAGIGFDQTISVTTFAGIELAKRKLDVPALNVGHDFNWRESTALAYLYKTFSIFGWRAAASVDAEHERVERPKTLTGSEGIKDLEAIRVPVGLSVFDDRGLSLRLTTSYVKQSGSFAEGFASPIFEVKSSAWVVDAALDYRLPSRLGMVSIGAKNLTDTSIELIEVDPLNPRVATKRFVFAKLRLVL